MTDKRWTAALYAEVIADNADDARRQLTEKLIARAPEAMMERAMPAWGLFLFAAAFGAWLVFLFFAITHWSIPK